MAEYNGVYEERYVKRFKIEAESLEQAEEIARKRFGRNVYKVDKTNLVEQTMELSNDEESTGVFHLYH